MSIKDIFKKKKSLKDRIEELEETVEKLEKASYIPIEIGGDKSFFHTHEWIGVSKILEE